MCTYSSPFTNPIKIIDAKDALYVIHHFCENCRKDAISQFHCCYADSKQCELVKQQIINDFSKQKGTA
jgi:hypothetical protein